MNKKTFSRIICLILFVLFIGGCAPKENTGNSGSDGNDGSTSIDKSQYINAYLSADPTSLDSTQASDSYSISVLNNVMEPLTRLEEGENEEVFVAPAGAREWEVSEDGLVWTFHLNDNKWSDGVPVTAHDYAYGITRALDPKTGAPYSYLLMPIKNAYAVNYGELPIEELGVTAIDEKTLEIKLEKPTAYFLSLTQLTVMLPQRKDIVEKFGDKYGTEIDYLVYNGPFKADSWIHNNEMILSKNQEYWDKDKVKLENVNYKIIQDENAIYNSLENGSIDSATVSTSEWVETFKSMKGLEHHEISNPKVDYMYFNQNDEVLKNANVRKALTLAIDREDLVRVIYDDKNDPAYGFIPPAVSVGETEFRSVAKNPIEELKKENPDPKSLLTKGLEELGMDTDPSKVTVKLALGGTDQWTKTLAEYLQQTYKKVLGINLEIEMLEWGVFISDFYNYDYQIGQMAWAAEFNDPLCMLSSLESSQDGLVIGWGDKRVDELLTQAEVEMDEKKRIEIIEEIEKIFLYDNACVVPLTFSKTNFFAQEYVKGLKLSPFEGAGYKYVYTEGRK